MDREHLARHVLYYAPTCKYSMDFVRRVEQSRVLADFDAHDVTKLAPPPNVRFVPTIRVFGEYMTGVTAFRWLEKVEGSGPKSETPGNASGSGLSSMFVPGTTGPRPDVQPNGAAQTMDYATVTPDGFGPPGSNTDDIMSRGENSTKTDASVDYDAMLEKLQEERKLPLPGIPPTRPI